MIRQPDRGVAVVFLSREMELAAEQTVGISVWSFSCNPCHYGALSLSLACCDNYHHKRVDKISCTLRSTRSLYTPTWHHVKVGLVQ